uniref:Ig-like domain-containing protein n=1 Tax=Cyprinus carpio TaxID=7962 RepID=A0A8C1WSI3_CYPCA
ELQYLHPEAVVMKPGESHKLTCTASGFDITFSVSGIHQAPGKGLEWIIYYYSDSDKSSAQSMQGRFTASKTSSNLYLHMNQLKTENTAVYNCARETLWKHEYSEGRGRWQTVNSE